MKEKVTVYFCMIKHPVNGWMRVGQQHSTKESAREWLGFARAFWSDWPGKISQCTVGIIDGKVSERDRRILDQKFNISA